MPFLNAMICFLIVNMIQRRSYKLSGEAKGRACRAKHDQKFFKFSESILQANISFHVDRVFDLILATTNTLYLIVCSAFDALC